MQSYPCISSKSCWLAHVLIVNHCVAFRILTGCHSSWCLAVFFAVWIFFISGGFSTIELSSDGPVVSLEPSNLPTDVSKTEFWSSWCASEGTLWVKLWSMGLASTYVHTVRDLRNRSSHLLKVPCFVVSNFLFLNKGKSGPLNLDCPYILSLPPVGLICLLFGTCFIAHRSRSRTRSVFH